MKKIFDHAGEAPLFKILFDNSNFSIRKKEKQKSRDDFFQ